MRRQHRTPRAAEATVTVSRAERDALHTELSAALDGEPPDLRSDEAAHRYQQRLDVTIRLLDQLGWDLVDERESFVVTAPEAALRRWLGDVRASYARCVRAERRALSAVVAGELAWEQAAARESEEAIHRDQETIEACDAILGRLHPSRRRERRVRRSVAGRSGRASRSPLGLRTP
jgi:hypothetical protein